MTKVLTVRLPPELLARAEAKAVSLGLDRAKYVRSLLEEDLAAGEDDSGRGFVSEDLVGIYTAPQATQSATNKRTREVIRQRLSGKRETNR